MEIEEFGDDDGLPSPPARGRPPTGQGRGGSRAGSFSTAPRGGSFGNRPPGGPGGPPRRGLGLNSEVGGGPGDGGGLDAELQQLGLDDNQGGGFGLKAKVQASAGRPGGGRPPPGTPRGPSRVGPGLSPLPHGGDLPPRPPSRQDGAFGLDAETQPGGGGGGLADEASMPPQRQRSLSDLPTPLGGAGAGGFGLESDVADASLAGVLPPAPVGRGPRRPSGGQQGAFGLADDVAEATAMGVLLPGPRSGLGSRRPSGGPNASPAGFGLDADVAEATVTGELQPAGPGGFGLETDVAEATLRPGGLPPPGEPPLGGGGFGLGADVAEAEMEAAVGAGVAAGQFGLGPEMAAAGMGGMPGQRLPGQGYPPAQGFGPNGPYGYEGDPEAYRRQQERWNQKYANTRPLDQVEAAMHPEDRWLEMAVPQAARAMEELMARNVRTAVVDVLDAREKLIESSAPPRLAYLAAVERAAADHRLFVNCRPSLLQTKLKTGANKLRKLIEPVMDPGDQGFVDLSYAPDGALQPETTRVWQFGLSLVRADAVGKTGLQRIRQPCLFIARMALFDRRANRFLGNVLGVRPEAVSNYDKRWEFDPNDQVIVRCSCVQSDPQAGTRLATDDALSVFIEFNVSYRLTVEDTVLMPQSEHRSSQLLDEINTCWAMVSFKKCLALQREVEITVPLYYGSIYDPQPMTAFYAEKRSKTPFLSAFKARESPVLQFRVGPLGLGKPPLVPYAYMPTTMLATHDLATALATYRMSLALTLARQAGPFVPVSDPVLAGFPPLLGDHHLLSEFLTRWRDLTNKMTALVDTGCCSPEVMPPLAAMVEAFRRCTIELAPLAHCPTIPPRHINNFVEYQGHRLRLVQHYCHVLDPRTHKILGQRNPVEPLSHAGFEFLHAPFDVAEVRVCMADRLEHPEPFFKH